MLVINEVAIVPAGCGMRDIGKAGFRFRGLV